MPDALEQAVKLGLLILPGLIAAFQLAFRLWPVSPEKWHVAIGPQTPANARACPPDLGAPVVYFPIPPLEPIAQAALATPRTRVLAGSPEEGRMTWVTRSLIWGFPDVTTAQFDENGLCIIARQVIGSNDHGVNQARIDAWITSAYGL